MKKLLLLSALVCALMLTAMSACGAAPAQTAETEAPAGVTDAAESAGPEATAEPTETPVNPAYAAYLELLTARREAIDGYFWQTYGEDARSVALADVYGDDTPELIYIDANVDTGESWKSTLHVVTAIDGAAAELYAADWDYNAGSGMRYTLFLTENDKRLHLFTKSRDEDTRTVYSVLDEADGPSLTATELLSHRTYENGAYVVYTADGSQTDGAGYSAAEAELQSRWAAVIMNNSSDDAQSAFIESHGCAAMTVDEAIAYLRQLIGADPEEEAGSWESAYRSFVLDGAYLSCDGGEQDYGTETDRLFGLYDLDGDGVPELIIHNGYSGRALRCAYCYGCADGAVVYLGRCPTEAYFLSGSAYTGLFGRYGDSDEAFWSYYSKDGAAVTSVSVCTTTGIRADGGLMSEPVQTTDDDSLFQASQQELTYFRELYTEAEIRAMGWDAFAGR